MRLMDWLGSLFGVSSSQDQERRQRAREVLAGNWTGSFTKPAPSLYPHQWNWDSGFIAIGYSHFAPEKARQELTSLFDAQWSNGMVPQIVFNEEALGGYFPEPDFWQCGSSPYAPSRPPTSGITMPPVHATAALRIHQNANDGSASEQWLKRIFPGLRDLHRYLYRERDPGDEGLVYIRHPWESGLDNSPAWDPPLNAMNLDSLDVPEYERRDLDHDIPAEQRPEDSKYDRYVALIEIFRRNQYEESAIVQDCPFLVQDPMFNSILCKAGEDLMEIGQILGRETKELEEKTRQTRHALTEKLWNERRQHYDAYDLHNDRPIRAKTCAGFMPLLCGAPDQDQADSLYDVLESQSFCPMHEQHCFSVPNYDLYGESFDADNYWRGPVWINTNWLLLQGLKRYEFHEKARSVRADIIELVRRWGFHEYFDPFEGTGYGTDQFSWTAALFIDALEENSRE